MKKSGKYSLSKASSPCSSLLAAALLLAACGKTGTHQDDVAGGTTLSPSFVLPQATGCLAGVVVDGVTGQRLDLTQTGVQLFVELGVQQLQAKPLLNAGDTSQPNLVGEYNLCNVPLDATLPLLVTVPGYQSMRTEVMIASTSASGGSGADSDLVKPQPTAAANLSLFAQTAPATAYTVSVNFNGTPVTGAAVTLMPSGNQVVALGGSYLAPDPVGFAALSGVTDGSGTVSFAAASLMLGGIYNYQVLPADPTLQQAATGSASVGYVTAPAEPYALHVTLAPANTTLVVVSNSLSDNTFQPDGSVSYVFNRPIEEVPGTLDTVTAVLDHAVKAQLVADVPGNKASEQAQVTIAGQTLTLKPKFQTNPSASVEPGLGITYAGVQVRPTAGQQLLNVVTLAPAVKFFGGQAPPSVATTLTKPTTGSGDLQSGSGGMTLPVQPTVLVSDQYGAAMAGVEVTFAVTSGGGSLSSYFVDTNGSGLAATSWTLGTTGVQTISASIANVTVPVTFTATFLPVTNISVVSGPGQSAGNLNVVPNPLEVIVRDVNNVAVTGAQVTFTTTSGTLLPSPLPTPAPTPNAVAAVTSDASGEAAVNWTLGTTASPTVTVTAGSATPVNFTVTLLTPTYLTKPGSGSGDAQTAVKSSTLPTPLLVTVTDQASNPLQNVTVQYVTGTNSGTINGTTSGATATAVTNSSGQASVTWHLGTAGAQTVVISVPSAVGITPLTYTATGT